jgi:hypothetical protein
VEIDLWSTSYVWNTGHQIRVAVSSSNYPRCLNNPNTADGIYKNTTSTVAHNSLYVDAVHCSCILLPEIPPNATKAQQTWVPTLKISLSHTDPVLVRLPERLKEILSRFPRYANLIEYRSFIIQ